MTWPASDVVTTNMDAGTDSLASARADIKDMADKVNQVRNHVTAFAQTVLDDATASDACATLGVDAAIQSNTYITATASGTNSYTITPSPAISAYAAGQEFLVTFTNANSDASTLQVSGLASPPAIVKQDSTGAYVALVSGDIPASHRSRMRMLSTTQVQLVDTVPVSAASIYRSYLAGMTLSTAGSSATMSIAAGQAADSTNAVLMNLAATSKTTGSWAVGSGNGGLDTGTIANSTWYYFYAIRRPDTGVVDVIFSTSSSAPTLPTNYTQYRYIGAGLTGGSGQWKKFTQFADEFLWDVAVMDVDSVNPGSASINATLSVPRGRKVFANLNVQVTSTTTGAGFAVLLRDPSVADANPSLTAAPLGDFHALGSCSNIINQGHLKVTTNTSAQIAYRFTTSAGSDRIRIVTIGWTDLRGKDL
jgi:hypothetical protein